MKATARTYFLELFILIAMATLVTGALRCHSCRRVRDNESRCNQGTKTCGANNVCKSDIRIDGRGRRFYMKTCVRRTRCSYLDQVFCNSRNTRCFKCCTDGDLCNANTSDVRAAMNGQKPENILTSEVTFEVGDGDTPDLSDPAVVDDLKQQFQTQVSEALNENYPVSRGKVTGEVIDVREGSIIFTIRFVALRPIRPNDLLNIIRRWFQQRGFNVQISGRWYRWGFVVTVVFNGCYPDRCQNGAVCRLGGYLGYYCASCPPQWTGYNCDRPVQSDVCEPAPGPCQNGGVCSVGGSEGYTCTCPAGFTGQNCETTISTDPCDPDPCVNGECSVDGSSGFTCDCTAGFTGTTCNINIDDCSPNPCENGGRCTDGVNSYTCVCATGFTGTNCQTNIDDCNPDPCVNGVCEDGVDSYTCTCETGWIGTNCDVPAGIQGRWYDGECGESKYPDAGSKPLPSPSIVGGDQAKPNEFPWQVSFLRRSGSYYYHFCGGSIINRYWVITAAHCNVYSSSTRAVLSGEHNFRGNEGPETITRVSRVVSHPSYRSAGRGFDIALIRLESPLSFNQNVQPICPPEEGNTYVNSKVAASGWGDVQYQGSSPSTLRYTTLNVTTNTYCQSRIRRLGYSATINAGMVCAGDNRGANERDTCQGDSGGPLAFKTADSTFQLVGVTSWGIGCASGAPGVYARVTEYMSWIDSVIPEDERS